MKKISTTLLCIAAIAVFQNCSSTKKVNSITAVTPVSFEKDVMPILQASCTPCHFPPDGRKAPLNTYDAAKTYITSIIDRVKLPVTDNKFMPFRSKKPPLSDSLINILVQWQKQDTPK